MNGFIKSKNNNLNLVKHAYYIQFKANYSGYELVKFLIILIDMIHFYLLKIK